MCGFKHEEAPAEATTGVGSKPRPQLCRQITANQTGLDSQVNSSRCLDLHSPLVGEVPSLFQWDRLPQTVGQTIWNPRTGLSQGSTHSVCKLTYLLRSVGDLLGQFVQPIFHTFSV